MLAQAGAKYNIRCYTGQDKLPELIRRQQIDAIVPSIVSLGADFPVPWVGYLCDFQHKHLPNLFSPEECSSRDHAFACMLEQAPAIMVTSQAVKRDIETFNPAGTHTVFALPFAPLPHNEWFGDDRANVVQKYGLPARYFLISSQFWRHKSHVTAFGALALLRQQANYQDVKVVCTGQTQDYRHPGYFDELQSRIADLGLTDAVVVLGHIPKLDQIQIMKQAVALVQPTLFEGSQGGLAVYDAVGLGVRAIVSDIPVNLEIQDSYVTFFQTGSAEDLAIKMAKILGEAAPRIDKRHQLKRAQQRITLFGDILLQAVAAASQPNGPNKLDTHEPTLQSVI